MRDIQKLNLLLGELGSRYSISNLKLPAHGAVGLRLKDGSELYLEHAAEQGKLYAYTPLTPLTPLPRDEASRLALFAAMLELNFLGCGVDHGVLSVHGDSAVCHVAFIVAGLQFETFDRALQGLITARAGMGAKLKAETAQDAGRTTKVRHSSSTLLAVLKQGAGV